VPPKPKARKPQRATPPNVVGQGPLVAAPGLKLGVVVIIRNEGPYLEEWLAYHLALGVEHFFIYDNGSDDDFHEIIERYVNHGLATVVHWPMGGGQLDAYSHALRFFGPSVDWLAYFDVDEFLVPLVDEDIPSVLARFEDGADVRVPRVEFGFSGHRTPPEALTIDAYTGVADVFGRDPSKPPRVKTILQPRGISAIGIHTATLADSPIARDQRPVPTRSVRKAAREHIQLNHYYTRSFEEFEAKRFRGSATGRIARPAIPFDLPTLREDASAHRFIDRTLEMMERMRSLEPRPYHYGSQLALGQFPHANDLGLFSEFAFANVAAEEPELRREPAFRLPNLLASTGFVGDISETGHVPSRGDLSTSIHVGPLLDRSRGRIDATWANESPGAITTARLGAVVEAEDGWTLQPAEGVVDIEFPVDANASRRCYALGFVLVGAAPMALRLQLVRTDTTTSDPVDVQLEHAVTYAGVVEFDDVPTLVAGARIRITTEAELLVHDLFLMSYG
jgi:hypothetical protein